MPKHNSIEQRSERARAVVRVLLELFPNPEIALRYSSNWELLVAVVLSAQCTDKKVNEVTDLLFQKYTSLESYAQADLEEFEQDIRQTGFYRNKAKNIIAAANHVLEKHAGAVPQTMDELVAIPGVGRKTANVILAEAFGIANGIAVDTHVTRLANKFGLLSKPSKNAVVIERELMEVIPKEEWLRFTHRMIDYGRQYSPARKKNDSDDPVSVALEDVA